MYLGGDKEVFLGRDYGTTHSYSDQLGGVIDSEIKMILDSCYEKALQILKDNRAIMDNMVKVLFEKETIYTEEVNMLFDGKTADEVIAYIDERQAKKDSYKKDSVDVKVNIVPEKNPFASEESTAKKEEEPKQDEPKREEPKQEPKDSE